MTSISYRSSVSFLLQEIPEIESNYQVELSKWHASEPPPHIIFGSVFAKYIQAVLAQEMTEGTADEATKRCFQTIERLAMSDDFETHNLVWVSILESLLKNDTTKNQILTNAGPRTRQLVREFLTNARS